MAEVRITHAADNAHDGKYNGRDDSDRQRLLRIQSIRDDGRSGRVVVDSKTAGGPEDAIIPASPGSSCLIQRNQIRARILVNLVGAVGLLDLQLSHESVDR